MGIAGHVGLAFDQADEQRAIAAFAGEGDSGDGWLKYQTEFPLIRENWWEMHHIFLRLAAMRPELAPLATVIMGTRSIGEGPGTDFFLHSAGEMQAKSQAFALVDEALFIEAANAALDHPDHNEWYGRPEVRAQRDVICRGLFGEFKQIASEVAKVADNGWAFIGFMA